MKNLYFQAEFCRTKISLDDLRFGTQSFDGAGQFPFELAEIMAADVGQRDIFEMVPYAGVKRAKGVNP